MILNSVSWGFWGGGLEHEGSLTELCAGSVEPEGRAKVCQRVLGGQAGGQVRGPALLLGLDVHVLTCKTVMAGRPLLRRLGSF